MSMTPAQRVEILRASCCVAAADGTTTAEEKSQLDKLADALGVGDASLTAMIERAERDSDFYKQQFGILKADPLECLDVLLESAVANGKIKESEFDVLKGLANQLEISEEDFRVKVAAAVKQT